MKEQPSDYLRRASGFHPLLGAAGEDGNVGGEMDHRPHRRIAVVGPDWLAVPPSTKTA